MRAAVARGMFGPGRLWVLAFLLASAYGCSRAQETRSAPEVRPEIPEPTRQPQEARGDAPEYSVDGNRAPVALVELFTSEGCSSCPSADRVLAKLVGWAELEKKNVLTLAFHVDYWNGLGWEDRFSDRAYSERQRWYARHEPRPRLYTPQMIVQGTTHFVGSKEAQAFDAVKAALAEPATVEISLGATRRESGFEIDYDVRGAARSDRLNLVLVQRRAKTSVAAGENAGETLMHVSIVRDHAEKQVDGGRGSWRVTPASDVEHALVAFVQGTETLRVLGANRLTLGVARAD